MKDKKEKEKAILQAATYVFSRDGFEKASVDEIALRARVGKGTIYQYFKNKKELFFSVVDHGWDELAETVQLAISSSTDILSTTKVILKAYLEFFQQNQQLFAVLIHEQTQFHQRFHKKYIQNYYAHLNTFEKVYQQGVEAGIFKPLKSDKVIAMITGMVNAAIFFWYISGRKHELLEDLDLIIEIILYGISARNDKPNYSP